MSRICLGRKLSLILIPAVICLMMAGWVQSTVHCSYLWCINSAKKTTQLFSQHYLLGTYLQKIAIKRGNRHGLHLLSWFYVYQPLAGLNDNEINSHKQSKNKGLWYKLFLLLFVCNFCEHKIKTLSSCYLLFVAQSKSPANPRIFHSATSKSWFKPVLIQIKLTSFSKYWCKWGKIYFSVCLLTL